MFPKSFPVVFFTFLSLIFILDGFGLRNGRTLSFYLILALPFLLYLKQFKDKKEIFVPKKLALLFLIFFSISLISVIFSGNVQKSLEYFLLYLANFLVLVFAFNKKDSLNKYLIPLILGFSFIYCFYSIFLNFYAARVQITAFLIPDHGYQLVFPKFGSHNHLGDFLVLPLTILLYQILSIKSLRLNFKSTAVFLILLPFFILSFSRSAYLGFAVVTVILSLTVIRKKEFKVSKLTLGLVILILGVVSLLFFSTVSDINQYGPAKTVNNFLTQNEFISNKLFFGRRTEIANQGLKSIIEKPLFGVGPGNFYLASQKFAADPPLTEISHNFFLDFFVENGIFAGLSMIVVAFLVFKNIRRGVLSFGVLGIFIVFQTDYANKILSFMILFSILIGLLYKEKETLKSTKYVLLLSAIAFVAGVLILAGNLSLKIGNTKLAFYLYPLNETALTFFIDQNIESNNQEQALKLTQLYSKLFPGDFAALAYVGQKYDRFEMNEEALDYYLRSYAANPTGDFPAVKRIYELKLNKDKDQSAKFAVDFFAKVTSRKLILKPDFRQDTFDFCEKLYKTCPYDF